MDKRSFMGGVRKVSAATIALAMAAALPGVINTPQAVVVRAASVPPAFTQQVINFKDLPRTHWAHGSVQWGVGKGLVVGYQDGTYKPSMQITEEEFVTVLSRYTKQDVKKTEYWSQGYYDALAKYELPLKGNSDKVAKKTGLSRGQIARIIAAKNGFNLDERQAIYYMYENDISNGMITGTMTFDSYGKDDSVTRAQIPAFFQRLEEKGHTTFMGKPSPVKDGSGIGGINGVPKDNTVITDKDFDGLTPEGGVNAGGVGDNFVPSKGDFSKFDPVANKHGLRLDASSKGFSLREDRGNNSPRIITYDDTGEGNFDVTMGNYIENKSLLGDLLKQTGKFNDADIVKLYNVIENEHAKNLVPTSYNITDKIYVRTTGVIDGSHVGRFEMYFGFRE